MVCHVFAICFVCALRFSRLPSFEKMTSITETHLCLFTTSKRKLKASSNGGSRCFFFCRQKLDFVVCSGDGVAITMMSRTILYSFNAPHSKTNHSW